MRSCEPCRVDITIPGKYIHIIYYYIMNTILIEEIMHHLDIIM